MLARPDLEQKDELQSFHQVGSYDFVGSYIGFLRGDNFNLLTND